MPCPPPMVLLADEAVVAVSKPAGMLVVPGRTGEPLPALRAWVEERFGPVRPVHRLDRDTSGVVLFARTPESHRFLNAAFEARAVEKVYLALAQGRVQTDEGHITTPLHPARRGKMRPALPGEPGSLTASTSFRVLGRAAGFTWLEVRPETGRHHQIRVHLRSAGHPLALDPAYGRKTPPEGLPMLRRTPLHARSLTFPHPTPLRGTVRVEAPLPDDLRDVLDALGLRASSG